VTRPGRAARRGVILPGSAGLARRIAALAAAIIAAAAIATAAAPAALAAMSHATLVSTCPLYGAVLARQPARVIVSFDQPVGVSAGSLEVFTPGGQRADTGGVTHNGPDAIAVALIPGLGNGTYTAAWHVVSADSHPVQGAFTFSVGAPSATHVPRILLAGSHVVGAAYAMTRWLEYTFFALLGGAVTFLIVCWPEGTRRRGVPALVTAGWAGLIASSLLALLLQGAYAAGAGLGQLLQPSLELTTLHSRLGTALQARQGLTVVAAIVATVVVRRLPVSGRPARTAAALAWVVLMAGIAATWATSDHASTGSAVSLAIGADIAHLVAMAVWTGGLVTLAAFALRGPATPGVATAVPRFSAIALGCVAVLAASGGYEAWRLVGSWGALFGTTYGVLVLVKIAGMGVLIGLGYLARRFVYRRLLPAAASAVPAPALASAAAGPASAREAFPADADEVPPRLPSTRALRTSVTIEAAVVAVVLAVTAILVSTPTGRESYAPPVNASSAFDTGGPGGAGTLRTSVTPGQAGAGPGGADLDRARRAALPPRRGPGEPVLPGPRPGPDPGRPRRDRARPVPRRDRVVRLHRAVAAAGHRPQRRLRRDDHHHPGHGSLAGRAFQAR
jgi:copper transport protein